MNKTEKPQFKSTYGKQSRRAVIETLREQKVCEVWTLCLVVAGFEQSAMPFKYAGQAGGAPSRIYAAACAANLVDANLGGKVDRNTFMAWLQKEWFPDGPDTEMLDKDVVARTVNDYIKYKATKMGSAERDEFIASLPGATPKGNRKHQALYEKLHLIKGEKGTLVKAINQMLEKSDPLILDANGNPHSHKTIRTYHDRYARHLKEKLLPK